MQRILSLTNSFWLTDFALAGNAGYSPGCAKGRLIKLNFQYELLLDDASCA